MFTPLLIGEVPVKFIKGDLFDYLILTRGICSKSVFTAPFICQSTVNVLRPWKMRMSNYKSLERIIKNTDKIKNFLMIGVGGGSVFFTVEKYHNNSKLTGIELSDAMINIAKDYFKIPEKVRIIKGDALKVLPSLDEKFDFIFIDVFLDIRPGFDLIEKKFFEKIINVAESGAVVCMNIAKGRFTDNYYNNVKKEFASTFSSFHEHKDFVSQLFEGIAVTTSILEGIA